MPRDVVSARAGGWPVKTEVNGVPVPDLSRIPREDWVAALRPLYGNRIAFTSAVNSVAAADYFPILAETMADELDRARRPALDEVSSADLQLPQPEPDPRRVRRTRPSRRQLNVGFSPGEYAALADAARIAGLKPTQLARTFVLNGTRRLLHEARSQQP